MNEARSWALFAGLGLLALGAGAAVVVAACGGSSSAAPGVDSGTPPAGDDSGADVSVADAADAGLDAAADAPGDDGGADAAACKAAGSASKCRSCCATTLPAGYRAFAGVELSCACAGDLCGPPEAGVPEDGGDAAAGDDGGGDAGAPMDAGPFGSGACTATCASPTTTPPDTACQACITKTVGSAAALGPCGSTIVSKCLPDPTCSPFLSCVESCP